MESRTGDLPEAAPAPDPDPGSDAAVVAILDAVPCAARLPRTVEALPGGLTNRNLKVTNADGSCVVRIPAAGPGLLGIDRDAEHANSRAAAAAGVGAPVLHYRAGKGLTVGFLPGRALSDADLHDPAVLRRVAAACRQLHAGPRFVNDFDMFEVQARYRRIVAEHGFRLPPRYDEFTPARAPDPGGARPTTQHRAVQQRPPRREPPRRRAAACGSSTTSTRATTTRASSWATSGARPPSRSRCSTCSSPPTSGGPRPAQVARARLFALVAKYGWTLWASIQHGSSPLDFDFWSWGMEKYDRAVAEFDGPDLEHLLVAASERTDGTAEHALTGRHHGRAREAAPRRATKRSCTASATRRCSTGRWAGSPTSPSPSRSSRSSQAA